jgi:hypothetical protein
LARSPCPVFAARHFSQKPFATSLPQDFSRELMFDPCAKYNPDASASLHSNFAALSEQRIDHVRCRTSHNRLMLRWNPSRTDRRSMLVAVKPFDLLNFQPQRRVKNPRSGGDRRNSVATRLRFAATPDVSSQSTPP